jgi:hypothetical protein
MRSPRKSWGLSRIYLEGLANLLASTAEAKHLQVSLHSLCDREISFSYVRRQWVGVINRGLLKPK